MVLISFLPIIGINAQDTILIKDDIEIDSTKAYRAKYQTDTNSVVIKTHSPTKAALLSAVLPGAGQIYNKKYWKLPLVYAGIGVSTFYFIRNQQWYKDYLEGYVNFSNTKDLSIVQQYAKIRVVRPGNEERAFEYYVNLYRRWRDWSVVFLAGTYLLNIIDATVDAYLFSYDISDKLSLKIEPTLMQTVAKTHAIGLQLNFNLH